MAKEKIKILLVDDHEMVRSGIKVFLETIEDFALIGEASDGEQAVDFCNQTQPDVILMDLVLPEMDGVQATKLIRDKFPQIQVIVLTSLNDESFVSKALQAGAIGYLLKNVSIDDLAQAIRFAHQNQPFLSPEATKALISTAQQPARPNYNLTAREKEVLAQMVSGRSNPSIADELGVSRSTIKTHVSNILDKLNVTSRVEAVALAIENDLLN